MADLKARNFDKPRDLARFVNIARDVASAAVDAGGADYVQDEELEVVGGEFEERAILKADTVDGLGAITSLSVVTAGAYYTLPVNPAVLKGGSGTGGTATLTGGTVGALVPDAAAVENISESDGRWYLYHWV